MLPIKRPGRALVAATATALMLAAAPAAMGQPNTFSGSINPNKGPIGSPLSLTIGFTLDTWPGKDTRHAQKSGAVLPAEREKPNGALFPSCSAGTINARRQLRRLPERLADR